MSEILSLADAIKAVWSKEIDEALKPFVGSDFFALYALRPASTGCHIHDAVTGVQCPNAPHAQLGARHVEHTECLHLSTLTIRVCERHLKMLYGPSKWKCSLCQERATFSEPVSYVPDL